MPGMSQPVPHAEPEPTGATFAGEPAIALPGGGALPLLGLGAWLLRDGREAERAVAWALEAGYRHVDTAAAYGNESSVGRAVRASGLPRSEVFVTTKMRPRDGDPERALADSLRRLGMDHVDLYLIHWPAPGSERLWPGFERLRAAGLARAIGVSNWEPRQLEQLVERADVPPAVNQIDFNPFVFSRATLDAHRRLGVVLEAYSPLGHGRALGDPAVGEVARRLGRTPAQVLVRWALERGLPAIPKSAKRERIVENRAVFDFTLGAEDMARLDALSRA
jgi:diketogulonate reductase-like aldo/keto reductase